MRRGNFFGALVLALVTYRAGTVAYNTTLAVPSIVALGSVEGELRQFVDNWLDEALMAEGDWPCGREIAVTMLGSYRLRLKSIGDRRHAEWVRRIHRRIAVDIMDGLKVDRMASFGSVASIERAVELGGARVPLLEAIARVLREQEVGLRQGGAILELAAFDGEAEGFLRKRLILGGTLVFAWLLYVAFLVLRELHK